MKEGTGNIANVNVVAFEMRFEQHNEAIVDRAIYEVVDQQIQPHARGHAENRGKAEAYGIVAFEDGFLRFDLGAAIERHRPQRGFLGAKFSSFTNAVTGIGDRYDDALFRREQAAQHDDGVAIGAGGAEWIAIAKWRPHERGKRNDDVRSSKQGLHDGFTAGVAVNDIEFRMTAYAGHAVLPIAEVIEHGHRMAYGQKFGHEN